MRCVAKRRVPFCGWHFALKNLNAVVDRVARIVSPHRSHCHRANGSLCIQWQSRCLCDHHSVTIAAIVTEYSQRQRRSCSCPRSMRACHQCAASFECFASECCVWQELGSELGAELGSELGSELGCGSEHREYIRPPKILLLIAAPHTRYF